MGISLDSPIKLNVVLVNWVVNVLRALPLQVNHVQLGDFVRRILMGIEVELGFHVLRELTIREQAQRM